MTTIEPAASAADLAAVGELFVEYATGLGDHVCCLQDFAAELAALPGAYGPPCGCLLLARVDGAAAGCVALRPLTEEDGELKRMYVRPAYRGLGLGRSLATAMLEEARRRGYRRVCLDTLPSMAAAVALYRALGFRPIEPYGSVPIPGALYLGLELT
jgi:ribosomal protein S18 acetylase RimI-like enzyme